MNSIAGLDTSALTDAGRCGGSVERDVSIERRGQRACGGQEQALERPVIYPEIRSRRDTLAGLIQARAAFFTFVIVLRSHHERFS